MTRLQSSREAKRAAQRVAKRVGAAGSSPAAVLALVAKRDELETANRLMYALIYRLVEHRGGLVDVSDDDLQIPRNKRLDIGRGEGSDVRLKIVAK